MAIVGWVEKVSEKIKLSPNLNRIKYFICIPCKLIILSWIVEVVEWIDGACGFFCSAENPLASLSLCAEAESLRSGFEGS